MALLWLAAAVAPAAEVKAVRLTPLPSRLALRVLTSVPLENPQVVRIEDEVLIRLGEATMDELVLPAPEAPVEELHLVRGDEGLVLHVRVSPEVPFEVRQEGALLTVFFGEEQADELRLKSPSELFGQLFPVPMGDASPPPADTAAAPEIAREGWHLGPLSVKPGLTASYVDADVVTEQSQKTTPDRYLQVGPAVEVVLPIADGSLRASYEPRLRFFSSLPEVDTTTQFANAGLHLPVGPRVIVRGAYHYSHGVLETREIDPGQEYFFDLGRFTRHDLSGNVSLELGPRMGAEVGAGVNDVSFRESTAFFPYHESTLRGGLYYDVGTDTRATASYTYHRVPPPDARPLVGSTGHDFTVGLSGEIAPRLKGQAEVGYRSWTSPEAVSEGRRYQGLLTSLSLQRPLRPNSVLELRGGRTTDLSNFDQNAFYVATFVEAAVTSPVPLGLTARGALGYQWNSYRVATAVLGEPRHDTILGWALGLGRNLGVRSYVRADYRRDRRRSNLDAFDLSTDAFIFQFGIGFSPSTGSKR